MNYAPVPDALLMRLEERAEAACERAAIMEYDGRFSRERAEIAAAAQWNVPVEWLRPQVVERDRPMPPLPLPRKGAGRTRESEIPQRPA